MKTSRLIAAGVLSLWLGVCSSVSAQQYGQQPWNGSQPPSYGQQPWNGQQPPAAYGQQPWNGQQQPAWNNQQRGPSWSSQQQAAPSSFQALQNGGARSTQPTFFTNQPLANEPIGSGVPGSGPQAGSVPSGANTPILNTPPNTNYSPAPITDQGQVFANAQPYNGQEIVLPSAEYGCNSCGNITCSGGCKPCARWNVSGDALFMTRAAGNSYSLLEIPVPDPPPAGSFPITFLDAADFDFGYELGYSIRASRMGGAGWGVEVGFTGMADPWRFEHFCTGILELQGPGFTTGSDPDAIGGPTPVDFQVINETDYYSGDLSAVRGVCDWMTLRAGVRWIRLDDNLIVHELSGPFFNVLQTETENNLLGGQLGADFKLVDLRNRFRINATMNFGLMYNHAKHYTGSTLVGPPVGSRGNNLAVMGEVALMGKFRLTNCLAIRGGYQVFGINGVAMSTDQLVTSDISNDVNNPQSNINYGSFLAHGAIVGIEFFW